MPTIELKLQTKPATIDVERIGSYEEISCKTNQRLQQLIQCSENVQRLRYQAKVGMDQIRQALHTYHEMQLRDDQAEEPTRQQEVLLQTYGNELDQIADLKHLAYQELSTAITDYLNELGMDSCSIE